MIRFLATYYDYDTDYNFGTEIKFSINDVAETKETIWEFALHKATKEAGELQVMLMKIELISL